MLDYATIVEGISKISIDLIYAIGLCLAVGSSTYALTFYLQSLQDGVMDASERAFLHTVYFVLRIGMGMLLMANLALLVWAAAYHSVSAVATDSYLMEWIVLAVIILNAVLMTKKRMPMWLGPALAGGSWYLLLIVHTLAEVNVPLPAWLAFYVFFVAAFVYFLRFLRRMLIPVPQQNASHSGNATGTNPLKMQN